MTPKKRQAEIDELTQLIDQVPLSNRKKALETLMHHQDSLAPAEFPFIKRIIDEAKGSLEALKNGAFKDPETKELVLLPGNVVKKRESGEISMIDKESLEKNRGWKAASKRFDLLRSELTELVRPVLDAYHTDLDIYEARQQMIQLPDSVSIFKEALNNLLEKLSTGESPLAKRANSEIKFIRKIIDDAVSEKGPEILKQGAFYDPEAKDLVQRQCNAVKTITSGNEQISMISTTWLNKETSEKKRSGDGDNDRERNYDKLIELSDAVRPLVNAFHDDLEAGQDGNAGLNSQNAGKNQGQSVQKSGKKKGEKKNGKK